MRLLGRSWPTYRPIQIGSLGHQAADRPTAARSQSPAAWRWRPPAGRRWPRRPEAGCGDSGPGPAGSRDFLQRLAGGPRATGPLVGIRPGFPAARRRRVLSGTTRPATILLLRKGRRPGQDRASSVRARSNRRSRWSDIAGGTAARSIWAWRCASRARWKSPLLSKAAHQGIAGLHFKSEQGKVGRLRGPQLAHGFQSLAKGRGRLVVVAEPNADVADAAMDAGGREIHDGAGDILGGELIVELQQALNDLRVGIQSAAGSAPRGRSRPGRRAPPRSCGPSRPGWPPDWARSGLRSANWPSKSSLRVVPARGERISRPASRISAKWRR